MRVLLDTHTLLWCVLGDSRLSANATNIIINESNDILMSPASYWEIAIKISIGKYTLNQPYDDFIDVCLNRYGFVVLPIETRHTSQVATLPHSQHHKDPFDRLLVAQSLSESIPIVSADAQLDAYGVNRLW